MISLDEATAFVLSAVVPLSPVQTPLAEASGRVIAEQVRCRELIPPFDNSAMDGFALRSVDTSALTDAATSADDEPTRLRVVGTVGAGDDPASTNVGPGEAVRIMTGAAMPPGADAIVPVEQTSFDDEGGVVEIHKAAKVGAHVRRAGEDLRPGDEAVAKGTLLSPAHIGVLASLGVSEVSTHPPVRVGVLSTGDELVQGDEPLRPGQIRDSNRAMLLALVREQGWVGIDCGHAPDDENAISAAIDTALLGCDALVTSGGVSMGDFDFVKSVLDRKGEMRWMQVAIKPAKPLAFGLVSGRPVFGLPGNPVSSAVSFELFARPALRRMAGHTSLHRPRLRAVATQQLRRKSDGKTHFARVVATVGAAGVLHARSSGGQGSHQLSALAGANALAVLPDGDGVAAGDEVELLLLGEPLPEGAS